MNKIETAWEQIFAAKKFDITSNVHYITANEMKAISGHEPRLLAKMDSSKDVPAIMKRHGYFLLPVSNGVYAIVRGDGFHNLEYTNQVQNFESKIKFNLSTMNRNTSEMQYLDYSAMSGLIEHVVNRGTLYPSIRGREGSGSFSFRIGEQQLNVNKAQIEVDLGLEGRDCIVLLEAKSRKVDDFIIRQLYYPYRRFLNLDKNKKIIPVFFTYDARTESYNLSVYEFTGLEEYNSINLLTTASYTISTPLSLTLSDISPLGVQYSEVIPQANDPDKILELVFKVSEGMNDARQIAQYFQFMERQSSYYREAAEALGLVRFGGDRKYELTEAGAKLVALDTQDRNIYFAKVMSNFKLIREILDALIEGNDVSRSDIEHRIEVDGRLSGATIPRRASSLFAWLKWIADHTGAIGINKDIIYANTNK